MMVIVYYALFLWLFLCNKTCFFLLCTTNHCLFIMTYIAMPLDVQEIPEQYSFECFLLWVCLCRILEHIPFGY